MDKKLSKRAKQSTGDQANVPFAIFRIKPDDIKNLGLREIKRRTKREYRCFLFNLHPDVSDKSTFFLRFTPTNRPHFDLNTLIRRYKLIQNLKYLPVGQADPDYEKILEFDKGFQTTADVDFGFNSHLAEGHERRCTV